MALLAPSPARGGGDKTPCVPTCRGSFRRDVAWEGRHRARSPVRRGGGSSPRSPLAADDARTSPGGLRAGDLACVSVWNQTSGPDKIITNGRALQQKN